jgi:hypothetical protein
MRYKGVTCNIPVTINHVFTQSVVAPTCTAQGYTLDKCAACGKEIKSNYTNALGHDFGTNEKTCKRCGTANPDYKAPVVANKTTVTLKKATVKKSAKKLVLQATVKVNGKAVNKKKVTFKFNGKKYTAKTNKKGVAKVTIKKTVLKKLKVGKKVTYSATYNKVTAKKTVKVKK